MKVLFVTPVIAGTGETVTCLHMAEQLVSDGHEVAFLSSERAVALVAPRFGEAVTRLGSVLEDNEATLREACGSFRPDVVVIADWPLLFLPEGVAPLVRRTGRIRALDSFSGSVVTLDHFGFTQAETSLFLGPPHLRLAGGVSFPPPPENMGILLPCPMHSPEDVAGPGKIAFRYWNVPLTVPDERQQQVRERWLGSADDILILHAVASWAWEAAEDFGLPFYHALPELLAYYLGDLDRPVTVVSVNNGSLLSDPDDGSVRIVNVGGLSTQRFEELLFAADLALTENSLSASLGKAACGLQPCAVLRNSLRLLEIVEGTSTAVREIVQRMERMKLGAVFPYDVFPTGMRDALEQLGFREDSSLMQAIAKLEIYGGETARRDFECLLMDSDVRSDLEAKQRRYVEEVSGLPNATEVLREVEAGGGDSR